MRASYASLRYGTMKLAGERIQDCPWFVVTRRHFTVPSPKRRNRSMLAYAIVQIAGMPELLRYFAPRQREGFAHVLPGTCL